MGHVDDVESEAVGDMRQGRNKVKSKGIYCIAFYHRLPKRGFDNELIFKYGP